MSPRQEREQTHLIYRIRLLPQQLDRVIEGAPAELEHLRSFDTHETVSLEPGVWEVRRQREYSPKGWRRAAD